MRQKERTFQNNTSGSVDAHGLQIISEHGSAQEIGRESSTSCEEQLEALRLKVPLVECGLEEALAGLAMPIHITTRVYPLLQGTDLAIVHSHEDIIRNHHDARGDVSSKPGGSLWPSEMLGAKPVFFLLFSHVRTVCFARARRRVAAEIPKRSLL